MSNRMVFIEMFYSTFGYFTRGRRGVWGLSAAR
jgi:hypothetical protein